MSYTICIGPICIPLNAILPLLVLFWRPLMAWVLGLFGIKEKEPELPPPSTTVTERTSPFPTVFYIKSLEHWEEVVKTAKDKKLSVIVDATATWCGPCRAIAPYFETLSKTYDGVFCKVDVDDADEVASKLGVRAMPTFIAFADGKELERFSGADKRKLSELVNKLCPQVVTDGGAAAGDDTSKKTE